jgi:hypothetical protein
MANLWATKGMGGERGIVGWFFVMGMVTATAIATATVQDKERLGKGGRGEKGGMGLFLSIVFIFDVHNCHCKMGGGGEEEGGECGLN